jgi:hypothetical protein
MICIRQKAKVCKVAGGPLHFTQLTQAKTGVNSTFKYIMLDLTAPLRFGKTDTDQNVLQKPTILEKDEEMENKTKIPPTQEDVGSTDDEDQNKTGLTEEDADTTDDEDEEKASEDPTYTNKAKIENSSKRVTRSNKNPEDIHCSLITHE